MADFKKREFFPRKSGPTFYQWSPDNFSDIRGGRRRITERGSALGCTSIQVTINGSTSTQVVDWNTNYVYERVWAGNQWQRLAYTDCNYVE